MLQPDSRHWLLMYPTEIIVYTNREQHALNGNACTRSIEMGLTSAEGQKLQCFKITTNIIFIGNIEPMFKAKNIINLIKT